MGRLVDVDVPEGEGSVVGESEGVSLTEGLGESDGLVVGESVGVGVSEGVGESVGLGLSVGLVVGVGVTSSARAMAGRSVLPATVAVSSASVIAVRRRRRPGVGPLIGWGLLDSA